MKKILFILFSIFTTSLFSQEIITRKNGQQVVLFSDGTWKNWGEDKIEKTMSRSYPDLDSESFFWEDGYDNLVEVKFTNYIEHEHPDIPIIRIVGHLMRKSKMSLKNPLSYVPKRLTLTSRVDSQTVFTPPTIPIKQQKKEKKKYEKKGGGVYLIDTGTFTTTMDTIFSGIITYYGKNAYGTEGENKCYCRFTTQIGGSIEDIGCSD